MDGPSTSWRDDWPIIGREEELSALWQAMERACAGRGSLVVVEGPPGSGRTRLVRQAAAASRQMGFRVVWLPDRADLASPVVSAAVDDAARGRRVLIVDDHEVPVSAPVAGDLAPLPALAVVTQTTPVSGTSDDTDPGWHLIRVPIRPLGPGAVMAIAAHMGIATPISTLERLHAATGGNALFVVETLTALATASDPDEDAPWLLSERCVSWMRARLDAMPAAARDALEAASVLGVESDVALVGRVAAAPPGSPAIGTTAFVALGNEGARCRFAPPLARDLVYASLPADRRTHLHARAAVALAADGAARAALAHRGLAAAAAGDSRGCAHYVARLVEERPARDAHANPSTCPYFLREGDHWAIGFGERAIRLNDRTGLLYLARLLSRPGVEFAAQALGERNRRSNGSGDAYDARLAAERARVRVTRRIRDGIDRIARAHPELAAHLEHTIRTGARCAYMVDPANAPRWEVQWS